MGVIQSNSINVDPNNGYHPVVVAPAHTDWKQSLRVVILLAGGVRPNDLSSGTGRTLLDLPLPGDRSLFSHWTAQASQLCKFVPHGHLACRAMVSQPTELPRPVDAPDGLTCTAEYDKVEFRGTGGLLKDIADEYEDEDAVLVAHANQVLMRPLSDIFTLLAQSAPRADGVVLAEPDGSSSGFLLFRARTLKAIRAKGYIDLKEQALPSLKDEHDIRVVRAPSTTGLRVRSLPYYLNALRALTTGEIIEKPDPFAEEWTAGFSLVQQGAAIHKTAIVHDAVVMRGARVDARATIVRSVVCEGAVVRADASVFDQVVPAPGRGGARA